MAGILSKLSKWDRFVAKSRIKVRRTGKFFSRKSKAGWATLSRHVKENRSVYIGVGASIASATAAGLLVRALADNETSAVEGTGGLLGAASNAATLSANPTAVEVASARRADKLAAIDQLDLALVQMRLSVRGRANDYRKEAIRVTCAYHTLLAMAPSDDDIDFNYTVDGVVGSMTRSGLMFDEDPGSDALLRSMIEASDDDTPLLSRKKDLETILYLDSLKVPMKSY